MTKDEINNKIRVKNIQKELASPERKSKIDNEITILRHQLMIVGIKEKIQSLRDMD